jgi:hypothetical protein
MRLCRSAVRLRVGAGNVIRSDSPRRRNIFNYDAVRGRGPVIYWTPAWTKCSCSIDLRRSKSAASSCLQHTVNGRASIEAISTLLLAWADVKKRDKVCSRESSPVALLVSIDSGQDAAGVRCGPCYHTRHSVYAVQKAIIPAFLIVTSRLISSWHLSL